MFHSTPTDRSAAALAYSLWKVDQMAPPNSRPEAELTPEAYAADEAGGKWAMGHATSITEESRRRYGG